MDFAQASSVGYPLAIAGWFEYEDRELEYTEWENSFTWLLPEVHPYVRVNTPADADGLASPTMRLRRSNGVLPC